MNPTRDIATSRPVVRDDHAQVHRLAPRLASIAVSLGLGRAHPTRMGHLFSREEQRQALAERDRRKEARRTRRPAPEQPVVVYESPDLLRGLREVEIELIELQLKVRTLSAIVMAGGGS